MALYLTISKHLHAFCLISLAVLCTFSFSTASGQDAEELTKTGISSRQLKAKAIYFIITLICSTVGTMLVPLIF